MVRALASEAPSAVSVRKFMIAKFRESVGNIFPTTETNKYDAVIKVVERILETPWSMLREYGPMLHEYSFMGEPRIRLTFRHLDIIVDFSIEEYYKAGELLVRVVKLYF